MATRSQANPFNWERIAAISSIILSFLTICLLFWKGGEFTADVKNQTDKEKEHFQFVSGRLEKLDANAEKLNTQVVDIEKRFPYEFEARFAQMWDWYNKSKK